MIAQIDEIISEIKNMVRHNFSHIKNDEYQILFSIYGKNGVMGKLEPKRCNSS